MPRNPLRMLTLPLALMTGACTTTYTNRNPVGEPFPVVTGTSLEKEEVTLPTAFEGDPALYMVGYVQETQFDLDRWAIGLTQMKFPCRIIEVPTIPGAIPSMIQGTIDDGMRKGIPSEDWASVVTLYGSAAKPVAEFTGNENPRNGRIMLIGPDGKVLWFWDQGFSASRMMELNTKAESLMVTN